MSNFEGNYYYYDVSNGKEKDLVNLLKERYFTRIQKIDTEKNSEVKEFFWSDRSPQKLETGKFEMFRINNSFWNNPVKIFFDEKDNFVAMQFLSIFSEQRDFSYSKEYTYLVTIVYENSTYAYCYQIVQIPNNSQKINEKDMFWKRGNFNEKLSSDSLKSIKKKEKLDDILKQKKKIETHKKQEEYGNAFLEDDCPKFLIRYLNIFFMNQKKMKKQEKCPFYKMVGSISIKGEFSIPYIFVDMVNNEPVIKKIYLDNGEKFVITDCRFFEKVKEFDLVNMIPYSSTSEACRLTNSYFQNFYDTAVNEFGKPTTNEEKTTEEHKVEEIASLKVDEPIKEDKVVTEENKKDKTQEKFDSYKKMDQFYDLMDIANKEQKYEDAFKFYENLSEENKKLLDSEYKKLCISFNEYIIEDKKLRDNLEREKISLREVYVSRSFEEQYKKYIQNNKNLENDLNKVIDHMRKDSYVDLMSYFRLKDYNKTGEFSKIRFGTGETRVIFLFGGQFKTFDKTKNALYLVDIFVNHDYGYNDILQKKYSEEKYHIYSRENRYEGKFLYEPTIEQKQYIANNKFPILCVGCAGSGKTSVSVHKYRNIVETYFYNKEKLNSTDVIYITFSPLLRDKAYEQISEIVDNPYCFTVDQFFKEVLSKKGHDFEYPLADIKTFSTWLHNEYFKSHDSKKQAYIKAIKEKDEYINYTYTYYRGLFKGSMLDYKRTNLDECISQKEFKENIEDDEYFTSSDKKALYDVCFSYYQYLQSKDLKDDTDLAIMALKRKNELPKVEYKYMIIDEVQDLTDVQLYALLSYSSSEYNICFYGDANQSINPTMFDVKKIDSCLMKVTSSKVCIKNRSKDELLKTFRSGTKLIKYLNDLITIRRENIGATSFDNSIVPYYKETLKEKYWANYINDEELIRYTLEASVNSVDCAIVVNTEKQKEELLTRYNQLRNKARVYTIFEAKGLEWDTVILYNFLSYENKAYRLIASGEKKNSKMLRMIYNRYYVGCTRAIKSLLILEDNVEEDVKDLLLRKKMSKISSRSKKAKDEIDVFINTDADASVWFNSGESNFAMGFYEQATTLYKKALSLDKNNKKYSQKLRNAEYMQDFVKGNEIASKEKARDLFNQYLYRAAEQVYQQLGDKIMLTSCKVMMNERLNYKDLHNIFDHEELYDKHVVEKAIQQVDIEEVTKEINSIIENMKGRI